MLILIPTLVFCILNPFLGNFGPKKSKLSILPENWHTWYLEDADSYFNICLLNFKPKTNFWANFWALPDLFYLKSNKGGFILFILFLFNTFHKIITWLDSKFKNKQTRTFHK